MGANEKYEAAMHGHVPSTADVREEYRNGRQFGELYSKTDFRAEFDRWLATVKAEAWQEGREAGSENQIHWNGNWYTGGHVEITNPYKEQA